jgi:hypothetical protein
LKLSSCSSFIIPSSSERRWILTPIPCTWSHWVGLLEWFWTYISEQWTCFPASHASIRYMDENWYSSQRDSEWRSSPINRTSYDPRL